MNLWLRLLWLVIAARFSVPIPMPGGASRLNFRVWVHDLDAVGHMNNGRYLTLMDLGRTDLMLRTGLYRAALRHKWTPIANAIAIRYRREMRLFQKFQLNSRLLYWDDTRVVMEQVFIFDGGRHDGQIAARALFKGGLYDRASKTFVPIARLMEEMGVTAASPAMPAEVESFLKTDDEMKLAGNNKS